MAHQGQTKGCPHECCMLTTKVPGRQLRFISQSPWLAFQALHCNGMVTLSVLFVGELLIFCLSCLNEPGSRSQRPKGVQTSPLLFQAAQHSERQSPDSAIGGPFFVLMRSLGWLINFIFKKRMEVKGFCSSWGEFPLENLFSPSFPGVDIASWGGSQW